MGIFRTMPNPFCFILCGVKSKKWHPTFGQIAKAIRAGNDTVGRTLIELELLGIIEIWRGKKYRVGKSLKKEKNIYEINWDISRWRPTPTLKQRLLEDCRNLGFDEPVFKREFKSDEEHRAIFSKICRKKARNKNAQEKDHSEFSEAEISWFNLARYNYEVQVERREFWDKNKKRTHQWKIPLPDQKKTEDPFKPSVGGGK